MTQALNDSKWTLRDDLHIEYKGKETTRNVVKTEKLAKIFSKEIKAKDTFNLTFEIVEFAILMKEGKFCLINFFVRQRNINIFYSYFRIASYQIGIL